MGNFVLQNTIMCTNVTSLTTILLLTVLSFNDFIVYNILVSEITISTCKIEIEMHNISVKISSILTTLNQSLYMEEFLIE